MGGRIIGTPGLPHACEGLPDARETPKATQWQCDDCDQIWVVVVGVQYNEAYFVWRRLTGRNEAGEDRF